MKHIYHIYSWMLLVMVAVGFTACDDDPPGLTASERFQFETEAIDAYIDQNGLMVEIDEDSDMRYMVLNPGNGLSPYVVDSVTISYTTRILETGVIVQSGTNEKVQWGTLILGVRVGLSFVQEGGSIRFFVPSAYAYGESGTTNIPANTTLIFEIDLIEVHARQLREEITTIETYLINNNLTATFDPHGFYYTIDEMGDGERPNFFSRITVNYEGRVLETDVLFDNGNGVGLVLANLIGGWQIGVPLINAGGEITLYLPSPLGYGANGNPPLIPENAPLIFDIDLISVF